MRISHLLLVTCLPAFAAAAPAPQTNILTMTLGDIGTFFSRLSTGNLLMPLTSSTDSPQQPSSLASQEAEASLIRLRTPSFGSITQNITLAPPQRQTLTLVHTNDVHARFDEFNDLGLDCKAEDIAKNNCFGGIARIGYSINKIRKEKQNVLLFDAGDEFTGTMASIISKWMNEIKYDLMTIGNHELDKGEEYLGQFIRNLSFPMITSNLNIDTAPFLKAAGLKPFTIFPQYRLAVIGFITNTTKDITPVKTIDVYNPVAIVQSHIDVLHAQGIKRIVCVSHNGYEHDKYLAENTRGISLIIGGHSHSLLLKNQSAPGVVGTYPSEVQNLDGKPTYVVQSHRFGDYLGNVEIQFDENDELVYLKGDPILLDQSIPKDQDLAQQVADYRKTFEADSRHVVAIVQESMDREKCKGNKECSLANLATDSILEYAKSTDCPQCQISLVNVGGLRSGLSKGPISIADVMNVFPFQNNVVKFNMTGQEIFDLLERTAAGESRDRKRIIHLPQFSGLKYTYDPKSPEFSRIRSASVADADGNNLYTPLVKAKMYQVVTTTFVAAGGDAVLTAPVKDTQQVGHETEDTIMDAYLAKRQAPDGSVFVIGNLVQGRITVL